MSPSPNHLPLPLESTELSHARSTEPSALDPSNMTLNHPRFKDRTWLHCLLLLATFASTTIVGSYHYAGFSSDFQSEFPTSYSLAQGLWYSLTILAILGAHEMGHYIACRYYQVDASLPYFIPVPPTLLLTGTLGAFIRIREPIPTKPVLFDIGVAGPIAGFIVAVPALFLGLGLSRVVPLPEDFIGLQLGEPILFRIMAWLILGTTPEGYSINLHPIGFAAWFGLLATMLNLFPFGQLDGGHISYAALGSRSTVVSIAMVIFAIFLTFISLSWLFWAIMMTLMFMTLGPRHPKTIDDHLPLDRTRLKIAFCTLVIFILCFTPAPIDFSALVTQH